MEQAQRLLRTLQAMTLRELNQVFDEYDLCNALITYLGAITTKVLEIDPEAIEKMIQAAKDVDE